MDRPGREEGRLKKLELMPALDWAGMSQGLSGLRCAAPKRTIMEAAQIAFVMHAKWGGDVPC
jgi:hypothetical protein